LSPAQVCHIIITHVTSSPTCHIISHMSPAFHAMNAWRRRCDHGPRSAHCLKAMQDLSQSGAKNSQMSHVTSSHTCRIITHMSHHHTLVTWRHELARLDHQTQKQQSVRVPARCRLVTHMSHHHTHVTSSAPESDPETAARPVTAASCVTSSHTCHIITHTFHIITRMSPGQGGSRLLNSRGSMGDTDHALPCRALPVSKET
jgi:hypothetical protein